MFTPDIARYLHERRKIVNARLKEIFKKEAKSKEFKKIIGAMGYTLFAGGKRIRPIIAMAVHELFGGDLRGIIDPACALELIHSGSLMLDDLPCMDNARLRRGKKAHHLVFGEATTILASVALLVAAFKIFSKIKSAKINAIMRETVAHNVGHAGLVRGQYIDLTSFKKIRTVKELEEGYYLKTGILFQNAVEIGALLGKANPRRLRLLANFGKETGLAFQIRDDIIDAESSLRAAGKDVRRDKKNAKQTYVSLLGLKKSKALLASKIESACADLRKLNLKTEKLDELTRSLAL